MRSLLISTLFATLALAQEQQDQPLPAEKLPPEKVQQPTVMHGQVTGDNVYVRSGPSTNYYPVMRVSAGEHVSIYDTQPGWVSIAPPKGAYTVIPKEFVDLLDTESGVVNGDRVWTYAGSDLSNQRYAKQVKLDKGAAVRVLGEVDEFYKIAPPAEAKLWISRDFVQALDGAMPESPAAERPTVQLSSGAVPVIESSASEPKPSYDGIKTKESRSAIEALEADLDAEFKKDLFQRKLDAFIERFSAVAQQDQDEVARKYAAYRATQLKKTVHYITALKQAQSLDAQVKDVREQFLRDRTNIKPPPPPLTREFVVKGKLLASAAYQNAVGPRRLRLVNPDDTGAMPLTVAYVEIEPDSNIDPQKYLGRFVGIRAKGQRLLENVVDRMVVYTAAEIVILEE